MFEIQTLMDTFGVVEAGTVTLSYGGFAEQLLNNSNSDGCYTLVWCYFDHEA
jgi:hypothetical protein